jgi:hypothetical protein
MTTLTFDQSPAARPGTADVGTGSYTDDPEFPPDPNVFPSADYWNQLTKLVVAMGKVCPIAIVTVGFNAGTPQVTSAVGPGGSVAPGFFTLDDLGAGHTMVKWTTGTLPPMGPQPMLTINSNFNDMSGGAFQQSSSGGFDRVEVQTFRAGVSTDLQFTIAIY